MSTEGSRRATTGFFFFYTENTKTDAKAHILKKKKNQMKSDLKANNDEVFFLGYTT